MNLSWPALAVGVALLGLLLQVWNSLQKAGEKREHANQERHDALVSGMKDMHAENKVALAKIVEEKDEEHKVIHSRLDKHRERLDGLRRDVDRNDYRITAIEKEDQ